MFYGYRSLRAITIAYLVITSTLLLVSFSSVANASASGGSTTVSATINPVRVVVVNDRGTITEILSNGPSDVTPTVHQGSHEGQRIALAKPIYDQYSAIIQSVDQNKTGVIYKLESDGVRKSLRPAGFLQPVIVSILFINLLTML